jgi:hypothetical protein
VIQAIAAPCAPVGHAPLRAPPGPQGRRLAVGALAVQDAVAQGDDGLLIVFQDFSEDRAREIARQQAERSNELLRTEAGVYVWRFNPRKGVYVFDQDIPTPSSPQGGVRVMTVSAR